MLRRVMGSLIQEMKGVTVQYECLVVVFVCNLGCKSVAQLLKGEGGAFVPVFRGLA